MSTRENETELITSAQQGDQKAFEKLMIMHDRQILQLAFTLLGNLADAQDVYQDTFMRAFMKLDTFKFQSAFGTWLTRITINLCFNRRRQKKIRKWLPLQEEQFSTDAQQTEVFLKQHVHRALQKLSPLQHAAFTLKHMQGYKIKDIAEILDRSPGTVKNALFRATEKLQSILGSYNTKE
jgi:RNA polymerase sigma-70 factor (ECF subfamily)